MIDRELSRSVGRVAQATMSLQGARLVCDTQVLLYKEHGLSVICITSNAL